MPIKPENMKLYPGGSIRSPEWQAIRARIATRARWRCEGCRVRDGAWGWRDDAGKFHYESKRKWRDAGVTQAPFETGTVKVIKIVCTVAHLKHDLSDHSDGVLRYWCQRCHNNYDAKHRASTRAATRRKELEANGQGGLL